MVILSLLCEAVRWSDVENTAWFSDEGATCSGGLVWSECKFGLTYDVILGTCVHLH